MAKNIPVASLTHAVVAMALEKRTGCLLASTILLWVWQSVQPTFDKFLPFVDISDNGVHLKTAASFSHNEILDSTSIIISVSEIIAMCVGVATMMSLYSLSWVCSEGNAKFWQNLAFILLATLALVGYGIDAHCVHDCSTTHLAGQPALCIAGLHA